MDELAEILLIKEKYKRRYSYLFKEFVREERVRSFLERKIIETNCTDGLIVISQRSIRKHFGGSQNFLKSLAFPLYKLKNSKILQNIPGQLQKRRVWSRDSGWISLTDVQKDSAGSDCYIVKENDLSLLIPNTFLSVYENLMENCSLECGNFDIFEFYKIRKLTVTVGRRDLSVYDIYKSCNFSPPQTCPITKKKIDWKVFGKMHTKNSPTLDKIDPSLGYVSGNVKIISHFGNALKSSNSIETLKNTIEYLEDCEREKNSYFLMES